MTQVMFVVIGKFGNRVSYQRGDKPIERTATRPKNRLRKKNPMF